MEKIKLHHRKLGEGPPLIIVHGLYGSSDNWLGIARELSADFSVYLVDQRNHGQSPHCERHSYPAMREDLLHLMEEESIERAHLMGHSMGGKTVMYFAAAYPDRLSSMIIIDIAPTAYQPAEDASQALSHDKILKSLSALDLSAADTREDVDRQLERLLPSPRVRAFLLKNLDRKPEGGYRWKINLPVLQRHLPEILGGLDPADYPPGSGITGFPVLFIRGEKSDYINSERMRDIQAIFPAASVTSIPGAGHWLHVEKPDLLIRTIRYFL